MQTLGWKYLLTDICNFHRRSYMGKMKVKTLSSSLWYFFTCLTMANCELVSNATFSNIRQSDDLNGKWLLEAKCLLEFAGRNIAGHECYAFIQFSVNMTDYHDTLIDTVIEQDPDSRWRLSNCWLGADDSLEFDVSFKHAEYLGSSDAKGIALLFTDQDEAESYAETAPILTNLYADPLILTTVLNVISVKSTVPGFKDIRALTTFDLNGIALRSNQGYVVIVFPGAVENFQDGTSSYEIVFSQDSMVYILRYNVYTSGTFYMDCSYTINSDDEVFDQIDTIARVYASYETAYAAAMSRVPATTASTSTGPSTGAMSPSMPSVQSTSTAAMTSSVPPVQSTSTSAVSETTVASSASTTTGGQTNSESPTVVPYVESGDRNRLKEVDFLRDKLTVGNYHIWNKSSHNILHCGRVCLADAQCMSVFYRNVDKTCVGHNVVYGNVNETVENVRYFYVV